MLHFVAKSCSSTLRMYVFCTLYFPTGRGSLQNTQVSLKTYIIGSLNDKHHKKLWICDICRKTAAPAAAVCVAQNFDRHSSSMKNNEGKSVVHAKFALQLSCFLMSQRFPATILLPLYSKVLSKVCRNSWYTVDHSDHNGNESSVKDTFCSSSSHTRFIKVDRHQIQ